MPRTLDCAGLPCPQPVLQCKQCIDNENPAQVAVLVDNEAARENVSRFLSTRGYAVAVERDGNLWKVVGTAAATAATPASGPCACAPMPDAEPPRPGRKMAVFITSDTIGRGDDELGGKLMSNFLSTLPELGGDLWRIILVNAGVKLAAAGSPVLDKLQALADAGVDILVCGACLTHFGLLERKAVGETTNMLDVVTSLQLASKVIQV
ncbi:MAG: sulfurtransferase-like selenium metabolism protein YedF [Thermodesulfobacteriota bacterium]